MVFYLLIYLLLSRHLIMTCPGPVAAGELVYSNVGHL
jgi:hypothetical protein